MIQTFKGTHDITFLGAKEPIRADLEGPVVNAHSHILYLVGMDGQIYNWATIAIIRKV